MSLVSLFLVALSATTFAIENVANSLPGNEISAIPVYLNVIDSSGTFEAKIVSGDKCSGQTKYHNISGLIFLGCADNTTKFGLFQDNTNIAIKGSAAEAGFTFPLKGYEVPEMSMNRFCGKTITKDHNIFMSIKKGPMGIDSWVINLRIENVKK